MRYRGLGNTGLEVSEIGFGLEWLKGMPEQTRDLVEYSRETGVTQQASPKG